MPDNNDAPELDQPDPERLYRNYLVTCKRLGVTAVPRERAQDLIREWSDAIAAGRSVPPITH